MWPLLVMLACVKEVPPHLRIDRTPTHPSMAPLTTLGTHDPLVRRPRPGSPGARDSHPQSEAIEAWAEIARKHEVVVSEWQRLSTMHRGSIGVPLARGAMLAGLEASIGDWSHLNQQRIAGWLGLTRVAARPIDKGPSEPLAWLPGLTPEEKFEAARHIATRWVLSGWMDGPEIDLAGVSQGLNSSTYTRIAHTPTGQLIRARARSSRNPEAAEEGREHLWTATYEALRWVGADGNRTQTAMTKERNQFREAHGSDPIEYHLRLSWEALIMDAAEPDSAGLAWIGLSAERLQGSCPDEPCEGLDVTANITRGGVWGPQSQSVSTVWKLIAFKSALDTLQVSLDKPLLYRRLPQVVDAFAGVHEQTIDLPVLRYRVASPPLMVNLSSMINADPTTEPDPLLQAIRQRLDELCADALRVDLPSKISAEIKILQRRNAKKLATP